MGKSSKITADDAKMKAPASVLIMMEIGDVGTTMIGLGLSPKIRSISFLRAASGNFALHPRSVILLAFHALRACQEGKLTQSASNTEVTAPEPRVEDILKRHHAQMRAQSPEESCHVMTGSQLRASGARLFAARDADRVLGIGALKPLSAQRIELKSMHTIAEARGKGIGRMILVHLIAIAQHLDATDILLETGSDDHFIAARQLYEKHGFTYIPPFGDYQEDPLSVFMHRAV